MKTDIERVIRAAYHWGRDNGEQRSEKNLADFFHTTIAKDVLSKAENLPISDVRLSLPDAKMLAEIIKWYRMQIVNHGLPDRKKYREFCKQKELELLGNEA